MNQEKRIIVTHCVDPHKFYFKYMDDCVNDEYSSFDYKVQCYGNRRHTDKQGSAYSPNKNEIIIFFDLILNKWLRGSVTNVEDDEITLWCIDNGVNRKSSKEFVQPLTENLQRDFNLVHIGGLSVLPSESKLNFDTLNVEMQVVNYWDDGIKNNFKLIIDSAKQISFIEEMVFEKHKFGSLFTETKNDKVVVINEILLQLDKAISCDTEEMSSYVSEKRLKHELCQLYEKRSSATLSKFVKCKQMSESCETKIEEHLQPNKSEGLSKASIQSEIDISKPVESEPFSTASSKSGIDVNQFIRKKTLNTSGKTQIEVHSKDFESKTTYNEYHESGMEEHLRRKELERLLKVYYTFDSKPVELKPFFNASGKAGMDVNLFIRKSSSSASSNTQLEVHSNAFVSKSVSTTSDKPGMNGLLNAFMRKKTSNASVKTQLEVHSKAVEPKPFSNGESGKSGVDIQLNPFIRKKTSTASGKNQIEVRSKVFESKAVSTASGKPAMNPFIRKKTPNASGKSE